MGGIEFRFGVTIDSSAVGGGSTYVPFSPPKNQTNAYSAGSEVYEIVDSDGNVYVLQARKDDIPLDSLPDLGSQMQELPEGWEYRARILDEDLAIVLTPDAPNPSVSDEFDQVYVMIPNTSQADASDSTTAAPATDAGGDTDIPEGWTSPQSMTSAMGPTFTLTPDSLSPARDFIYCELVFNYGDAGSDIYSTSPVAPCDSDWWDSLDLDSLAAELNAESVVKNGPEWWSMDTVQEMTSEPTTVGGIQMVYGAVLPPGTMGTPQYEVFNTAKYQYLVYEAGKPTYQLVDADGNVYVLQGYKVDQDQLATLGDQFQNLPEGWQYIVVTPSSDLVLNLTPAAPIPSVQDEFDQIYIQIPAPTETMTSAAGEQVAISLKLLPNSRDFIYCELVFDYGDAGQDIYSTSPIAPCDTDWWDNLDLDAVAAELGANSVIKNGPQWWSMDEVGVLAGDPVTIAGVEMNFGAVLPPGTTGEGGTPQYTVFNTSKNQFLLWEADQPTYRLVDPDGYVYILQGNKIPYGSVGHAG